MNFLFSNRSRTSPMALVGLASIGFRGIPGVNLQVSRSLSIPFSRIAGMTLSYVGISLRCRFEDSALDLNKYDVPIYCFDNISSLGQPRSKLLATPFLASYFKHVSMRRIKKTNRWAYIAPSLQEQLHVLMQPTRYVPHFLSVISLRDYE